MNMNEKFERLLNRLIESAESTNDVDKMIALSGAAINVASMMQHITAPNEDIINELYYCLQELLVEARDHERVTIDTVGSASELCEQAGRLVQMLSSANELIRRHYDHDARDMDAPVPGTSRETPIPHVPNLRREALSKVMARMRAQMEQGMWAQLEQSIWEEASDTEDDGSEDDE